MPSITTIVLSGGQSTRMGQDKALLEISGIPLLRRLTDIALQSTDLVLITTSWPERYQNIVSQDCQFVIDTVNQGPIVAFSQALQQVQTNWILLLSCDLPNLNTDVITIWLQDLECLPQATIAYLPRSSKGWEPLCGFYRANCLESVQEFVQSGGRSFQQWLQTQAVEILPVNDPRILFNCNTPEDLELVRRNHQK